MPTLTESPFTGGERFDPKQELHKLTDGQDRYSYEGVQDFKHKHQFQIRGLSELENYIVGAVEENPKVTREDLLAMLAEGFHDLGLTAEQEALASSLIGKFMNRHAAVMDVYERNGGRGKDIFNEVFGQEARGDVEVIVGPSVLYFRCHNQVDFALIDSRKFLEGEPPSEEDIRIAESVGGTSIHEALNPALSGAIIAENADGRPFDNVSKRTYEHEKRHALNKFFLKRGGSINTFYEMENAKTPEGRVYWMKQYLRFIRSEEEDGTADEILAFFGTGDNAQYIIETLTRRKVDGGLYDYFDDVVNGTDGNEKVEDFLVRVLGEEDRAVIRDSIQQVLGVEYREVIIKGLESIRRLTNRGYSFQEVASVLGRIPLTEWTKISSRLAAERYLPRKKFWLPGGKGVKVVVADTEGKFYGGVTLDKYDPTTGLPSYETPRGVKAIELSVEDLKLINYPFKSAELWYEVWVRSGGDPDIKDKLGFDFSSQKLLSADEAWGKFRSYCEPASNVLRVFNTYRKLLREAY